MAGGISANGLARWNGTTWQAFPGVSPFGTWAEAMTTFNGELVAGGYSIAPYNGIARWNGTTWQTLGTGLVGIPNVPNTGKAQALAVYNGELIVGGFFSTSGGIVTHSLARWNGSAWAPGFGIGAGGLGGPVPGGYPSSVYTILPYRGALVVAGAFATMNAVPAFSIAWWTGSVWQPLGSGLPPSGSYYSLPRVAVYHGGLVACGGTPGSADPSNPRPPVPFIQSWSAPVAYVALSQPGFASMPLQVFDGLMIPSHQYYNVFSLNPCANGIGSGPYGGLCFDNIADLLSQLQLPPVAPPFHFTALATTTAFGPFGLPPGLTIEAIAVDVTTTAICISAPVSFTTF
jgi:hypothetical protein